MAKAILISINPKWVAKILNGEKTLEIRKTKPKNFGKLFLNNSDKGLDVYIYCTSHKNYTQSLYELETYKKKRKFGVDIYRPSDPGFILNGKVVAKFTLNCVEPIKYHFSYYDMGEWTESYILENSCLTSEELDKYFRASKEYDAKHISKVYGYAWHIENLEIFSEPKPLSQFLIPSHKVQGIDKNGSEKTFTILKPLNRAPQSWCFVEI